MVYKIKTSKQGLYALFFGRDGKKKFRTEFRQTMMEIEQLITEIQAEAPHGRIVNNVA